MADVNAAQQVRAETGHELSDLSPKSISVFAVGLAALVVIALLVCYALLVWLITSDARRAEPPNPLAVQPQPMAQPRLAVEPGRALKTMRQQEEARLKSFGWIDQEKGIVHIPIERAIDILAEKGLPARQTRPQASGDSRGRKDADSRGELRS